LGRTEFLFSSAGLDPKPIDGRTISFLAEKRIDISRQTPKAVSQVPNLDHYHVIVALAKEAQKVFPPPPTKTVALDWNVQDPSLVQGSPEQIRAAYEQTFQYINSHIRDLVEAILGEKQNGEKKI
jgi:protein-tyrosine-phosphatase